MVFFWKKKDTQDAPATDAEDTALEDGAAGQAEATVAEQPAEAPPDDGSPAGSPGLFGRVRAALSDRLRKTKEHFVGQIKAAIKAAGKVDDQLIENIEEVLIKADIGGETSMRLTNEMREFEARGASTDELLESFKGQLLGIVGRNERRLEIGPQRPFVILVIGVNGTGKTTTIGKIAAELQARGLRTLLAAGDTFRAAAVEQLKIWADRTGSAIVAREMGADPSGLAFEAVEKAKAEGFDVVMLDTAGRLHTKANLMEELKKIDRVIRKVVPDAPHETLLVLDATTGQNAIQQARVFTEAIPVTGLVMTKLDGTAKGGVLIGIRNLFDIPVLKIGVGEAIDDLRDFNPQEFVDALFEE